MNVYMQVNENPGEKLQSLSKKDEFIHPFSHERILRVGEL